MLRHPVAILLHAKEVRSDRIVFTPLQDPNKGFRDERIGVEVHGAPDLLQTCEPKHHYIVFGSFWYSGSKAYPIPDSDKKIFYRNVKMTLYRSSQIERVDVVDPMRD